MGGSPHCSTEHSPPCPNRNRGRAAERLAVRQLTALHPWHCSGVAACAIPPSNVTRGPVYLKRGGRGHPQGLQWLSGPSASRSRSLPLGSRSAPSNPCLGASLLLATRQPRHFALRRR